MAHNGIDELSEKQFDEFVKKPVAVVDFFAEWCLSPNSKLIFNPCINDIKKVEKGSKVLSFGKSLKESFAIVKSTHKILSSKKIKILTERGREITCTPEHLLLTKKGFKKADKVSEGDFVSAYLFSSYPQIENDKRIFLNEKKIRKAAKLLGMNKERYIAELKEKGLLKIRYNDERAYILASLMGFLLTDGSLSFQKNNERNTEFFVEKEEDIKELINDLTILGFKADSRKQEHKSKIGDREFIQRTNRIRITKTSIFILFVALGGIAGEKFLKGLKIPNWVANGPREIQKAFLQGFLGGDGPRVTINTIDRGIIKSYNKPNINPIEFHFYSKAENSPKKFIKELSHLLNNFNVKIKKTEIIKEERYKRKDKKTSMLLKIHLKSNLESAYNYASIGFKYSNTKKLVSSLAREYLRERLIKIKEREKKKLQAIQMKNKFPTNEIAKRLNLSYSVISNWLSEKKAFPPRDAITYNNWLKLYSKSNKNIIFDRIKSVKKYNGKNYPFISLSLDNTSKMFVANEIIHHNCMPCLMMAPVIEELSEKFKGKIAFAKVNVDDNQKLSQKFKVMSIPTIIVFKKGEEAGRLIGSLQSDVLEERIKKIVG